MYFQGGTGTEKALFMRLHLLQGIVSFHQGQRDKAKQLLTRVCELQLSLFCGEMEFRNCVCVCTKEVLGHCKYHRFSSNVTTFKRK